MANTGNIVDVVSRVVIEHFEGAVTQINAEAAAIRERADTAIAESVARIETEARARIDSVIENLPSAPIFGEVREAAADVDGFDLDDVNPMGWLRAQAKSRAWRTLIQGLLAAVVVAASNVVFQAIRTGSLNVFSWEDWKVVGAVAVTAVLGAVVSYFQNALNIKPPKVH